MKNNRVYRDYMVHVDSVIEVRLCMDSWERVKYVAWIRRRSYSWVVRYCLFRLIKRKGSIGEIRPFGPIGNPRNFSEVSFSAKNLDLNEKVWCRREGSSLKHRHRLCLYGEDERFLRLAALSLNCSMTHLIRFALEKYLGSLCLSYRRPFGGSGIVARARFWRWLGIKLYKAVELHSMSPKKKHFFFTPYQKSDYF